MRKSLTAEEILARLMAVLLENLEDLKEAIDVPEQAFQYGEKTAYIECFEYIQDWEKAEKYDSDFDVESYFNFK